MVIKKHYRSPAKKESAIPSFGKWDASSLRDGVIVFFAVAFFVFLVFMYIFSDFSLPGTGCVAVIEINGELTTEGEPSSLFELGKPSSDEIADLLESMNDKDNVKAVVVEINSPGGSVVASREIYEGLREVEKPTVAYIREIGASGGYYVAVGADEIVANPDSITGSIGVITTFTDLRGLLEKIGANFTSITSGKNKDLGAFYKGLTNEQREMIQELVDEIYKEFYNVVKERRGSKLKNFDSIADGRILTGRQALKYGLVDQTGNFKDALRRAADLAGLEYEDVPEVCYYSASSDSNPFAGMFSGFTVNLEFGSSGFKVKS